MSYDAAAGTQSAVIWGVVFPHKICLSLKEIAKISVRSTLRKDSRAREGQDETGLWKNGSLCRWEEFRRCLQLPQKGKVITS